MSSPELMAETRDLSRRFGDLVAVDRLNLQVRKGEIFGIVGPDGAGKTTTLRLLCGLIAPTSGEARIVGHDVNRDPGPVRDRIGYMPQQFGQYPDLTVEENMVFYADLFGILGEERDRLMERLLQMTRMAPFRDRRAGRLSGGMKQKLALMCTLLHHPEALLLDEPTNGVDPVSRRDFWAILYQLVNDGLTVIVATAYLDEAERCNRVALMYGGKIIREASPRSLRKALDAPCYALNAANARTLRARLKERADILSAESFGNRLHIFLDPKTQIETLISDCRQEGFGSITYEEITPSLEDTFIALIRREDAARLQEA